MTSQNCAQNSNFEVDGFWRRLLSSSGVLVTTDTLLEQVGDGFVSKPSVSILSKMLAVANALGWPPSTGQSDLT
jgi:hypothetical protein